MAISIAMLFGSAYRLSFLQSHFNLVLFISSLLLTLRTIIGVVYYKIMWLNAPARYTILYFGLNISRALLYYLYERRLAVFFRQKAAALKWTMYVMIAIYIVTTVVEMVVFGIGASNTNSGGYMVDGESLSGVKMAVYIEDTFLSVVVLIGTLVSLGRIIAENPDGETTSLEIYVASDAFMFFFAFAISLYKTGTAIDPTGQSGALPEGNLGFQHLLDTIKNLFMAVNLILPSQVTAARSSVAVVGMKDGDNAGIPPASGRGA
ncbi:hypothetical protein BJ742DRAFT_874275 [Cladochytrium replicatum]|nr:hypothetical protein BJ742DRAFT_874275 [Cladochytrium replicatum]